jgi:hypothetical protein
MRRAFGQAFREKLDQKLNSRHSLVGTLIFCRVKFEKNSLLFANTNNT